MDIAETIAPDSQQVNADDLIGGPVTVRVTSVERGSSEQPVFIHTDAFAGRTYRPSKSMRRVLVAVWGPESSTWIGRSMTLFRNPEISFGREKVGGIQIAAMSNVDKPVTVALTVSRGKRAPFTVQPLAEDTQVLEAVLTDIQNATSIPALKTAWDIAGTRKMQSHPDVIAATNKRKAELGKDE